MARSFWVRTDWVLVGSDDRVEEASESIVGPAVLDPVERQMARHRPDAVPEHREREARAGEAQLVAGQLPLALHLTLGSLRIAEVDEHIVGAVLGDVAQIAPQLLGLLGPRTDRRS